MHAQLWREVVLHKSEVSILIIQQFCFPSIVDLPSLSSETVAKNFKIKKNIKYRRRRWGREREIIIVFSFFSMKQNLFFVGLKGIADSRNISLHTLMLTVNQEKIILFISLFNTPLDELLDFRTYIP